MGDKKGKDLALELIDDLLNGELSEIGSPSEGDEHTQPEGKGITVQPVASASGKTASPGASKAASTGSSKASSTGSLKTPRPATETAPTVQPRAASVPISVITPNPSAKKPATDPADDKTIDLSQSEKNNQTPKLTEDRTTPLSDPARAAPTLVQGNPRTQVHNYAEERVRATVGRPGAFRSMGAPNATEAALAQSESLRIAQSRILELENEIERLRLQNEELAAAGETLRRRADELLTENSQRESEQQHLISTFEQERNILSGQKEALSRDNEQLTRKNEELELRISTNIQKIRVRERELENRLELVKMEGAALIRAKDEMILDLKRQIDTLNLELNNYRTKNQELNRVTNDKQEMLRRTVKALRLALSMLEGEEDAPKPGGRKPK